VSEEPREQRGGQEAPPSAARPRSPARLPKVIALGSTLIAAAILLALCLILLPLWAPVLALASSLASAWVLGEVRALAWFAKVPELSGEPWGMDAWAVLAAGIGIAALGALSPSVAWPVAWILAALIAVLGVRVLVR
jgi:hypothetical protein